MPLPVERVQLGRGLQRDRAAAGRARPGSAARPRGSSLRPATRSTVVPILGAAARSANSSTRLELGRRGRISSGVRRREAASAAIASGSRRLAAEPGPNSGEDALAGCPGHCRPSPDCRARYSSMKVLPAGAGKSRCAVQPPASGSERIQPPRRNRRIAAHADGGAEPVERAGARPRRPRAPMPSGSRPAPAPRASCGRASRAAASAAGCRPGRPPGSGRSGCRRAAGRATWRGRSRAGVSTAPIGPG